MLLNDAKLKSFEKMIVISER